MKKALSTLLITLSFFSCLHSEECHCFELGYDRHTSLTYYRLLETCLIKLPSLQRLIFLSMNHPPLIIKHHQVDPSDTVDFYWNQFCSSYCTKGIMSLFSNLRKDIDGELKHWKRFNTKELAAIHSSKKPPKEREKSTSYFLKELALGTQIKKDAEEVLSNSEEDFFSEFLKHVKYCRQHYKELKQEQQS